MKIGILTPHYAYNYGAVLQAFALLTYLREIGHDAMIINRRPKWQAAVPSFWGRMSRLLEEHTRGRIFVKNERKHLRPETMPIILASDLPKLKSYNFDAVIVGSDQVWRDDYAFNSFGYNEFLDFVDSSISRKIAYAPSFGKESWHKPEDVRRRVETLLHDFHAISVRETSGVNICKDVFHVVATHVLDPTFLLEPNDYIRLYGLQRKHLNQQFMSSYILDGDKLKREKIIAIAKKLNLRYRNIIMYSHSGRVSSLLHRFYPIYPSVETWLLNIAKADFVVTNSFHGMAFSIIFRKQFVVFGNAVRGMERFRSMLQMFGLEDRLLSWDDDVMQLFYTPIDYTKVEPLISEWQQRSFNFIQQALE